MRFVALLFVFNLLGAVLGQNPEALDAQRCTEVEACARCEGASQELITCRPFSYTHLTLPTINSV